MAERRYSEEEVAKIIEAAVRGADERRGALEPTNARPRGMSLAEIQEIGAEVGIPADAIAAGAAAIDLGESSVGVTGTTLGVPHGVAGSVPLPRELTDREWGILVGHLRETFNAIGKTESEGGMRSWRNGNLQFRVEPTATGTVLRMRTRKADGQAIPQLAMGLSGFTAAFAGAMLLLGEPRLAVVMTVAMIPLILGFVYQGKVVLPRWGEKRKAQMGEVATFVLEMTSRPALESGPAAHPEPSPWE